MDKLPLPPAVYNLPDGVTLADIDGTPPDDHDDYLEWADGWYERERELELGA